MRDRCEDLGRSLLRAVGRILRDKGCDCIIFSGGVDTTFVALAAVSEGLRPTLISVLLPGNADEEYVRYVSESLKLDLVELRPSPADLMPCVDEALKAMVTIDPIEVISASAVCLGLREAARRGCHCVATGDGGDELFIGYDFLLNKDPESVRSWLDRVLKGAFFNSVPMSRRLGVNLELPLYSSEAKEIAVRALEAGCDVAVINGRRYGKVIMRRVIEASGLSRVAWRPKAPITRGSGVDSLLDHLSSLTSVNEAVQLSRRTGVLLPSLPHTYLLRRRIELGLPTKVEGQGPRCPICGSPLSGNFCRFCGAYIGDGGLSVYSDQAAEATGASKLIANS